MNGPGEAGGTLRWPRGAAASVSLTFDVDAESALMGMDLEERSNYSAFSERRFGVARGLPRILAFLADEGIKGTFYVPGYTAEHYPDQVGEIVEQGHELAHHGVLSPPPQPDRRRRATRGTRAGRGGAREAHGEGAARVPLAVLGGDGRNLFLPGRNGVRVRQQPDGR